MYVQESHCWMELLLFQAITIVSAIKSDKRISQQGVTFYYKYLIAPKTATNNCLCQTLIAQLKIN